MFIFPLIWCRWLWCCCRLTVVGCCCCSCLWMMLKSDGDVVLVLMLADLLQFICLLLLFSDVAFWCIYCRLLMAMFTDLTFRWMMFLKKKKNKKTKRSKFWCFDVVVVVSSCTTTNTTFFESSLVYIVYISYNMKTITFFWISKCYKFKYFLFFLSSFLLKDDKQWYQKASVTI